MPQEYTQAQITEGLMAMVAWVGSPTAASKYLKAERGLDIKAHTLNAWKHRHAIEYNELRDKYADQLEAQLAHEYREVARRAVDVQKVALEQAEKLLSSGEDKDPARSAANISRVAQSSTDKLLSLTGRPTSITESRGIEEILRSLAARGVLQIPETTQD